MKYLVTHATTYDYESPVLHGRHRVFKRPRVTNYQNVSQVNLEVHPRPVWHRSEVDYFGNTVDNIEVIDAHERLEVIVRSEVVVSPRSHNRELPLFNQSWEEVRRRIHQDPNCYHALEMCLASPLVPLLSEARAWARSTFSPGRPLLSCVEELNRRIFEEFTYDSSFSDVATPLATVFAKKRGVCQDFAHFALTILRMHGIAGRYVSGYLETQPPPGKPRLIGADASHAWASVFLPDYGWLDFDPTNNVLPDERHIVVAWGRDFSEVSPLRGVVHGGGRHSVSVSVDVAPQPATPL